MSGEAAVLAGLAALNGSVFAGLVATNEVDPTTKRPPGVFFRGLFAAGCLLLPNI